MPATHRNPDLLIAGASARAASFSALRAGLKVAAADLFADRDLTAIADAAQVSDWPADVEHWAAGFAPSIPLMITGGLENEPELLDRIAAERPLAAVCGEPLRLMRHPEALQQRVEAAGIPFAPLGTDPVDDSRRWLIKPRRSSGGHGVSLREPNTGPVSLDCYLQEHIDGKPGSVAFLAHDDGVQVLGVTEMLLPDDSPANYNAPFAYTGSITSDDQPVDGFERLGSHLAAAGLKGLFGVDFIRRESPLGTEFVIIEVNPRYTAGMEVLELRSGGMCSFVAWHLAAFAGHAFQPVLHFDRPHVGKRIVYAPRSLRVGPLPVATPAQIRSGTYEIADVPASGTAVPAGAPICTVFATAKSTEDCRWLLRERESKLLASCSAE